MGCGASKPAKSSDGEKAPEKQPEPKQSTAAKPQESAPPAAAASTAAPAEPAAASGGGAVLSPDKQPQPWDKKPRVVFVLGGPGCGKGTQCGRISKEFGYVHLSAGDLLREEVKSGSDNGKMIGDMIKAGKIVPGYITVGLLEMAIRKGQAEGSNNFLVDGFPRAIEQVHDFTKHVCEGAFVLYFSCPQSVMQERLLERGKTSGRSDDNMESIQKRFVTFKETSMPVIDYFRKKGKVIEVSAKPPPDDVYADARLNFVPSTVVMLLGAPASGKKTICKKLGEEYSDFEMLEISDVLASEAIKGTKEGCEISSTLGEDKVVRGGLTSSLMKREMNAKLAEGKSKFILLGYPSTAESVQLFPDLMGSTIAKVIFLDVSPEIAISRFSEGRDPDSTFDDFTARYLPVISAYESQGLLLTVSADGTVDESYEKMKPVFDALK
eukprot:GFYU01006769.1.p1 GENE.GFYU01006769.1~~GFYU01006769.1.p1  ORF type:complete len:438 (+),score=151.02 GFYU01006769.1:121-1434(+)